MRQLDIKGAYLNGKLEEEIFMRQPEGFDDGSGRVCKLKLSLYGLKQAGRVWNKTINSHLSNMGYTRTNADPCVYYKHSSGKIVILTLWVDDIIMVGDNKDGIEATVTELKKLFEVKDLGEPKLLLGIQIIRDRTAKTITLSQKNYINTILSRFNYSKVTLWEVVTPGSGGKDTYRPSQVALSSQYGWHMFRSICHSFQVASYHPFQVVIPLPVVFGGSIIS
jgi:Reverse transcriptase (RNA-dependent DNA polymerase)